MIDYNTPKDWEEPTWHFYEKVHGWRNYVSEEIQDNWDTFSNEQKQMLARYFDEIASREEWD